MRVTDGQNYDS